MDAHDEAALKLGCFCGRLQHDPKCAAYLLAIASALRKAAANEREHCKCATCCLPTIVAERDEAMSTAHQLIPRTGELSDELASEKQRTINVFVRLDKAESERDAAVNDANRQKDQHERLRVSLAVALGLLSEMEYWRQLTGTRFEAPLRNFLADMRAGR